MHPAAYEFVKKCVEKIQQEMTIKNVCEIGSCNVNGSVRELFSFSDIKYVGVDCRPGPGVDIVCPGEFYRPYKKFQIVVCCETFEHTENWRGVLWNILDNVLEKNLHSSLIVTCANEKRTPHTADGVNMDPRSLIEPYSYITEADLRSSVVEWWGKNGGELVTNAKIESVEEDLQMLLQII